MALQYWTALIASFGFATIFSAAIANDQAIRGSAKDLWDAHKRSPGSLHWTFQRSSSQPSLCPQRSDDKGISDRSKKYFHMRLKPVAKFGNHTAYADATCKRQTKRHHE